jgi:hypothetical protein
MHTNLNLEYHTEVYQHRDPDPNDNWDRGDTSSSTDFGDLFLSKEGQDTNLTIPGEVNVGDQLFIIVAEYSTGDSFGHDENACIEVISAHRYREIAEHNCGILRNVTKEYSANIFLDDGRMFKTHVPWTGYFESLTELHLLERTIVEPK